MIPLFQVKNSLISFTISFFIFSLMIMFTAIWVNPFVSTIEDKSRYPSLPQETDQLNLIIVQDDQIFTMVSIQPHCANIKIEPISGQKKIRGSSVQYLYESQSPSKFADILSDHYRLSPLRYAILSPKDLCSVIELIGGIPFSIDSPLTFTQSEVQLTLTPGLHLFNGEQVLQYLSQFPDDHFRVAEAIIQKILHLIPQDDFLLFYTQMLDYINSNLSLADYDRCFSSLKFMVELSR